MSGIVGIFYLDGRPVDPVDLQKMVDILAHRGPDGADIWYQGSVGLGHRMLWTTPESLSEKLPLVSRSGDLVLTADARIDNRDELIEALGLSDRPAGEITDSDLILTAYQKWGEDCPAKLIGDFAFVIWDEREQQLFCARDHMGVKPFYYYHQPERVFVFASEIKGLLCLPEVPRELNEVMIGYYLASIFDDTEITFYQDILRFPAAHTLIVDVKGFRIQRYWSLNAAKAINFGTDDEYIQAFREIFTEAVCCRFRSAFPVGSSLSGGLDSSAIVCVAGNPDIAVDQQAFHTFSLVYDEVPQVDESLFINAVLKQGKYISHLVPGDQQSPLTDAERVMWHLDEAVVGPNGYLPWSLNRAAQQTGVRILLDGFDGDTVVSHGYAYLNELAYYNKWTMFAAEVEKISERIGGTSRQLFIHYGIPPLQERVRQKEWISVARGICAAGPLFGVSRSILWRELVFKSLASGLVGSIWPGSRRQPVTNDKVRPKHLIGTAFARQIDLDGRMKKLDRSQTLSLNTARERHWLDLTDGGLTYVLELNNKAAAAFSLEDRHPFMDKRLMEFCLGLPADQKLRDGWPRRILREALRDLLPEQVRWRVSKPSPSDNFIHTLHTFERERLSTLFVRENVDFIKKYIEWEVFWSAYQRLLRKKTHKGDVMILWKVINLTMWLKYTGLLSI